MRQYSDLVHIVKNNAQEFAAKVDFVLKTPDPERVKRGIELAKQNSWENTVKTMQDLIREAIGNPDRPSTRKPKPIEESTLSYTYQATQGS